MARFDQLAPTVAFTMEGYTPRQAAERVGQEGIFVWDGNYYVLAVTDRLGVEDSGGMGGWGSPIKLRRWKSIGCWPWRMTWLGKNTLLVTAEGRISVRGGSVVMDYSLLSLKPPYDFKPTGGMRPWEAEFVEGALTGSVTLMPSSFGGEDTGNLVIDRCGHADGELRLAGQGSFRATAAAETPVSRPSCEETRGHKTSISSYIENFSKRPRRSARTWTINRPWQRDVLA